jgi:two-component system, NarL family, sensor histidine kinase BarA
MFRRAIERWFGGMSLEHKCRFAFGMVILLVVSGSGFWHGQTAEGLLLRQTTQTARMLVAPTLLDIHYRSLENEQHDAVLKLVGDDLGPLGDLPNHEARVLSLDGATEPRSQPRDDFERTTLARFIRSAATDPPGTSPGKSYTFADGTPTWAEQITRDRKEYRYIQAVFFKPTCLIDCHAGAGSAGNHLHKPADDGQHQVRTQPGDLAGAVVVSLPTGPLTKAINSHRATMITFALATALLAMLGSYLAIHFVVVRPAAVAPPAEPDRSRPGRPSRLT